jgi:beta-N-acetylhexosaminidase
VSRAPIAAVLTAAVVVLGASSVALAAPGPSGGAGVSGTGVTGVSGSVGASIPTAIPSSPSKLLGQRVMVGFPGLSAPGWLRGAVRSGQVGSVILFGANISTTTQVRALTASLQRAAAAGGNPPLLIATDQEGGQVKRLQSGPPSLAPPQMVSGGPSSLAGAQGADTGRYMRALGINMDLAPVLDVPTFGGAFIWQQGRAFSFSAPKVVAYGGAFALGLQSAHVAATGKHFPGDGSAAVDTDTALDELHPTATQLAAALTPYQSLIARGLDAVMVTTAGFKAYDPSGTPAALSPKVIGGLLRGRLRFGGVVITDSLGAPTGHSELTAGVLAARAGADILLYTDGAPGVLSALESSLGHGTVSQAAARASYQRILALKQKVGG